MWCSRSARRAWFHQAATSWERPLRMQVRTFGVNKGVSMGRLMDMMARRLDPHAVAFDCVLCVGHFMSRDESIFSYFEGVPSARLCAHYLGLISASCTVSHALPLLRLASERRGCAQLHATLLLRNVLRAFLLHACSLLHLDPVITRDTRCRQGRDQHRDARRPARADAREPRRCRGRFPPHQSVRPFHLWLHLRAPQRAATRAWAAERRLAQRRCAVEQSSARRQRRERRRRGRPRRSGATLAEPAPVARVPRAILRAEHAARGRHARREPCARPPAAPRERVARLTGAPAGTHGHEHKRQQQLRRGLCEWRWPAAHTVRPLGRRRPPQLPGAQSAGAVQQPGGHGAAVHGCFCCRRAVSSERAAGAVAGACASELW
jgi:hypothetical protein